MARFQVGHQKKGGRGKNTKNKKTLEVKQRIEFVLGLIDETIERDIKAMNPRERAMLWKDLQEYVRPKLNRTTIESDPGSPIVVRIINDAE